MPKLKTRKAAAKRFKVTKSGKIMRYKAGKKHILEHKSSKLKREKCSMVPVHKTDIRRVKGMLHI
ncbi:50S ribosomal protein L35 [Candidatus Margulisiibacteriota bacterium]